MGKGQVMEWSTTTTVFNILTGSETGSGKRKRQKKGKWTSEALRMQRIWRPIDREKRQPRRRILRMTETQLRKLRQKEAKDDWKIRWGMKNLKIVEKDKEWKEEEKENGDDLRDLTTEMRKLGTGEEKEQEERLLEDDIIEIKDETDRLMNEQEKTPEDKTDSDRDKHCTEESFGRFERKLTDNQTDNLSFLINSETKRPSFTIETNKLTKKT
jgi:hypothetical protein